MQSMFGFLTLSRGLPSSSGQLPPRRGGGTTSKKAWLFPALQLQKINGVASQDKRILGPPATGANFCRFFFFSFFGFWDSPTKRDYRNGTLVLASLLEDLG